MGIITGKHPKLVVTRGCVLVGQESNDITRYGHHEIGRPSVLFVEDLGVI